MKLFVVFVLLQVGFTFCTTVPTKEYYDPDDENDEVVLWKTLFDALKTILAEVEKTKQNIALLTDRLDDDENKISKLMEYTETTSTNQKNLMNELIEISLINWKYQNGSIMDVKKSHEKQEYQILKLTESVNLNGKYLNESMFNVCKSAFRNDSSNTQNKPSNAADEWTTVLRRQDGSVEFFRNWTEYKNGFGDPPNGELFLGLEELHQLTSATPQELMIELEDWDNVKRTARYDHFVVGSEDEKYSLKNLGKYSGNAGDSLRLHLGMSFTTKDADNDHRSDGNCALWFKGGWWYNNCIYRSHLTGVYRQKYEKSLTGIDWFGVYNNSHKFVEMKIRPSK